MTATITPVEAEARPSERGRFHAYAVTSRTGPHVTMQAGVLHANRFWTTTSAESLKARSVASHAVSTAVLPDGSGHRIVSGRTMALPPFRPWVALEDPCAQMFVGTAVARLGAVHIEQLVGYLESAGSIPADWFPTRRVLLVTRVDRSLVLDGNGVVAASGSWDTGRGRGSLGALPSTGDDGDSMLPYEHLGSSHRAIVRLGARVHLGVETPTGPVALPARWLGVDRFALSAPALSAVTADLGGRASAVFDQSSSRRPDEKIGAMFRGSIRLVEVTGDQAVVGLSTERITTWNGFEAATVDVER